MNQEYNTSAASAVRYVSCCLESLAAVGTKADIWGPEAPPWYSSGEQKFGDVSWFIKCPSMFVRGLSTREIIGRLFLTELLRCTQMYLHFFKENVPSIFCRAGKQRRPVLVYIFF